MFNGAGEHAPEGDLRRHMSGLFLSAKAHRKTELKQRDTDLETEAQKSRAPSPM